MFLKNFSPLWTLYKQTGAGLGGVIKLPSKMLINEQEN